MTCVAGNIRQQGAAIVPTGASIVGTARAGPIGRDAALETLSAALEAADTVGAACRAPGADRAGAIGPYAGYGDRRRAGVGVVASVVGAAVVLPRL